MRTILSLVLVYVATQADSSGNVPISHGPGQSGRMMYKPVQIIQSKQVNSDGLVDKAASTDRGTNPCNGTDLNFLLSEGAPLPSRYLCEGPCKRMKAKQDKVDKHDQYIKKVACVQN